MRRALGAEEVRRAAAEEQADSTVAIAFGLGAMRMGRSASCTCDGCLKQLHAWGPCWCQQVREGRGAPQ